MNVQFVGEFVELLLAERRSHRDGDLVVVLLVLVIHLLCGLKVVVRLVADKLVVALVLITSTDLVGKGSQQCHLGVAVHLWSVRVTFPKLTRIRFWDKGQNELYDFYIEGITKTPIALRVANALRIIVG